MKTQVISTWLVNARLTANLYIREGKLLTCIYFQYLILNLNVQLVGSESSTKKERKIYDFIIIFNNQWKELCIISLIFLYNLFPMITWFSLFSLSLNFPFTFSISVRGSFPLFHPLSGSPKIRSFLQKYYFTWFFLNHIINWVFWALWILICRA